MITIRANYLSNILKIQRIGEVKKGVLRNMQKVWKNDMFVITKIYRLEFFYQKSISREGIPYLLLRPVTLFSCSPPEISLRNQRFIHLAARTYFTCPSSAVPLKLRLQIEAISAVDEQKMEMTTAFLSNVYNHNFSVQSNLVQKDSINIWFYSNSIGMTTDFHSATTTQPLIQLSYH